MSALPKLKPHPEFPTYLFAADGRVFRFKRGLHIPMTGTKCGAGYRAIDFCRDGKRVQREYVHRVICKLFNGGDGSGLYCRHLDGDMTNNAASNLAWGTASDNYHDKRRHGTGVEGAQNPMAVLTAAKVQEMRSIRQEANRPYYQIAKDFGVSTMTAFRAVTKRAWAS